MFQSFSIFSAEEPAEPVSARLVAEEQSIQPGRPFWVGVELNMEKGWDTYWINPGSSGFPTQVDWQLPEGFQADAMLWPYPEKFINGSLVAFGYTNKVLLLKRIIPPEDLSAHESIDIGAQVNWLACNESCVPGGSELSLSLPVKEGAPQPDLSLVSFFMETRRALPQELSSEDGSLTVQAKKEEIILNFKPQPGSFAEINELSFIPEQPEVIDYMAPQNVQRGEEGITLNIKRPESTKQIPDHVKGVLLVAEKGNTIKRAIQVDTTVTASQPKASASTGVTSFGIALGFAFLGGIILNVMPCVLPVIALKIFGFVKMGHQRRGIVLKHGAVFSVGVLVSFWILSGALLILRAYGEGIGWGFQLQEPMFVAVLIAILFLLGLSLFGVFEFGTSLMSLGQKSSSKSGSPLGSSFMSGILATLVATPCTGPLLGPALGFAMTLPAVQALAVFTSMGIGMAFPYFLFSLFPNLVRFLPKPGNWMITFKQLMGFIMMVTVVWLVWVFGAQTTHIATSVLLVSLVLMAIGAWVFGKWATPSRSKISRWIAMSLSLLMIAMGMTATIKSVKQQSAITGNELTIVSGSSKWEQYSPERVEQLRAQGVPVFVDFTAKWCLICQANKVALHSSDVQRAFEERGVVMMIADWTKKDPAITQELEKLGRSGVPVYALYPGNSNESPYILPQTLTAKVIHDYLDKLKILESTVYAD
ncbi:MAG: thioredoxin family protein [Chlamydiales bacterium]